ncbi:MAG TPA: hypothetical protein VHU24_09875, partial [Solirubrobacterales bacterium]|nr:hypothetical protein [Solirubrobacterales bacterium]
MNAAGYSAGAYFFLAPLERLLLPLLPLELDELFLLEPERALDDFDCVFVFVLERAGDFFLVVGALAAATRVRPPATATSGWKPSSRSAI